MYQLQSKIGEALPISLVLLTDGQRGWIVFIKTSSFSTIIDLPSDEITGCDAMFDIDGFTIEGEDYSYNKAYDYKSIPLMLKWLKKQNMVMSEIMF